MPTATSSTVKTQPVPFSMSGAFCGGPISAPPTSAGFLGADLRTATDSGSSQTTATAR